MQTATVFHLNPNRRERETRHDARQLLFEQMVHFAPDVIFVADLDGRFTFVNDQAHELTGYTQAELVGMKFTELIAPEYRNRVTRFYARQYLTGRHFTELEFPIITKSGASVWVGQNVSFQRTDHLPVFLGIARDITAKKVTEQALEQSEQMGRELFENSVQAMFRSTPDGRIVSANRSLLRLLRYSSFEELASVDLGDLYVDPEDRLTLMALLREKGYCRNIEYSLKRKDGKSITVSEYSRAIKDQKGEIVLLEGVLEDISLRKAYEATTAEYLASIQESEKKLKELNAQKDRLFSVLSHDLRSPFASILGFCDLLLEENHSISPEERNEFVGYIKDAAASQLTLVNRLLEWSRLESNRFQSSIADINLTKVIEKSMNGLRGLALQKNISMRSSLDTDLTIHGDDQLLTQVFNNLIANALKFTPSDGEISVGNKIGTDGARVVTVRDTGVGIPDSDIPKLFKVDEKYTRDGLQGEKGTGLGLTICKEIMEKHGGEIEVESELGKGTTFSLIFPNSERKDAMTVLIVDDEKGMRALHARFIRQAVQGVNIVEASNGAEALAILESTTPNLIVSDYSMPAMDGYELLNAIQSDSRWNKIPVLIATGVDSDACLDALRASGAKEVWLKPVAPQKLGEVAKQLLLVGEG